MSARSGNHRLARSPHSRIHDCKVNRPQREQRPDLPQPECRPENILGGNHVADIHKSKVWIQTQHDPFHRRNKMVIPDKRYSCFLETRDVTASRGFPARPWTARSPNTG